MGSEIIIDNDNKKLWLEDIVKIISKESDLDEDRINLIIKEINELIDVEEKATVNDIQDDLMEAICRSLILLYYPQIINEQNINIKQNIIKHSDNTKKKLTHRLKIKMQTKNIVKGVEFTAKTIFFICSKSLHSNYLRVIPDLSDNNKLCSKIEFIECIFDYYLSNYSKKINLC